MVEGELSADALADIEGVAEALGLAVADEELVFCEQPANMRTDKARRLRCFSQNSLEKAQEGEHP